MEQLFPGFYAPAEADLVKLWSEGSVILDASALLKLYEVPEQTWQSPSPSPRCGSSEGGCGFRTKRPLSISGTERKPHRDRPHSCRRRSRAHAGSLNCTTQVRGGGLDWGASLPNCS